MSSSFQHFYTLDPIVSSIKYTYGKQYSCLISLVESISYSNRNKQQHSKKSQALRFLFHLILVCTTLQIDIQQKKQINQPDLRSNILIDIFGNFDVVLHVYSFSNRCCFINNLHIAVDYIYWTTIISAISLKSPIDFISNRIRVFLNLFHCSIVWFE